MVHTWPLDNEMIFYSDDGKWVEVKVEKKRPKIIGKDFVSGGLHDFETSTGYGFVITMRTEPDADYKKATEITRKTITEILGSQPTVMPPAYASGLIILRWSGDTHKTENELLNSIGIAIKESRLEKHLF